MGQDGGDLPPANQLCHQLNTGLWRVSAQASGYEGWGQDTASYVQKKGGGTNRRAESQAVYPRAGSLGENCCVWLPDTTSLHTNSGSILVRSCRGPGEEQLGFHFSGMCSVVKLRDTATRTAGGGCIIPDKSQKGKA